LRRYATAIAHAALDGRDVPSSCVGSRELDVISALVRASASTSDGSFASVHGIGGAEGTASRVDDDATAEVMAALYLALLWN
jgi:hypothetical protein